MTESRQGRTFLTGLFGGALVGTAVGVLFAPQISAAWRRLQRQLTDAAADVRDTATERGRDATAKAGNLYGKALSVVARGAEAVEERAADAAVSNR